MKQLLTVILILFSSVAICQQRYTERKDPNNPNRTIVELKPVTQRLNLTNAARNILEEDKMNRQPIAFKQFDMVHPKTGKPLDPNKVMNIKMPDGTSRSVTIKEFYSQVNELEKQLNTRGRTLRDASSLRDLKSTIRQTNNKIAANTFKYNNYDVNKFKILEQKPSTSSNTGASSNNSKMIFTPIKTTGIGAVTNFAINWVPDLYVSESTSDFGTVEFPATWVKQTIGNPGRTKYPITAAIPSFFINDIKKVVWQIAKLPFDNTLKSVETKALIKSVEQPITELSFAPRGWESMPEKIRKVIKNTKFATTVLDFSEFAYPEGEPHYYYIRAIMYNDKNEPIKFSPYVTATFGHTKKTTFIIKNTERNSTPGFNYSFPEDKNIPFGIYIKGSGLNSEKPVNIGTKGGNPFFEKLGYKITGNATLGLRYFNFNHIIDNNAPLSNDFDLISANFKAVAGAVNVGNTNKFEDNGVTLTVSALNGAVPPVVYPFTSVIPGTSSVSINKSFTQSLDVDLLNTRFMIGPIPIKIYAALKGEAGINLSGSVDMKNFEATGEIKPYVTTRFVASGGVDAFVAYATLNAEVNPLLNLDMPLTFSSSAEKPLSFNTNISGLKGRVYLKAGFYYPCPSLEKIVGWLSGDEDLPLCECAWEYNIFDFNGFEHTISY